MKVAELFLAEILKEVEKSSDENQYISTFLKVKPWEKYVVELRLESSLFPEKTLKLLLRKMNIHIENNKMFKRCL